MGPAKRSGALGGSVRPGHDVDVLLLEHRLEQRALVCTPALMVRVEEAADQQVGFAGAAMMRAPARGASGPGRKAWGACSETLRAHCERRTQRANNCIMRPEILNPLFTEVEALKGVGPQVAKLLKKLGIAPRRRPALSSADGSIERMRAPAAIGGAARPQRHPRAEAVRDPRKPLGPRADARVRRRWRGQHDQPHLFQQSGLGEAQPADGREADRLGQARSLWRRVADHPSRGRASRGRGRSRRCASRSIR